MTEGMNREEKRNADEDECMTWGVERARPHVAAGRLLSPRIVVTAVGGDLSAAARGVFRDFLEV
jgi:hypothetical protein